MQGRGHRSRQRSSHENQYHAAELGDSSWSYFAKQRGPGGGERPTIVDCSGQHLYQGEGHLKPLYSLTGKLLNPAK